MESILINVIIVKVFRIGGTCWCPVMFSVGEIR